MAPFILEMVIRTVIDDGATVSNLENTIADLKSLRSRLTRRCRTLKDQHAQAAGMTRIEIYQLRSRLAHQEKQLLKDAGEAKSVLSEKVEPRLSILSELIKLVEGEDASRYSDALYEMSVRVLFCSCSLYVFLRNFLTLPSPTSIYDCFHDEVDAILAYLRSLDMVGPYLSSQIAIQKEIDEGAVLAVDAVSCTNTFIGVKKLTTMKWDTSSLCCYHL
jgi:hypothetical protein